MLQASVIVMQAPEYLRYLLTGIATVLLLGLFCRFLGRMITPFAEWVTFRGTCTHREQTPQGTLLVVQFQDHNRLSHKAAFLTAHPSAAGLQPEDTVKIAMRTKVFAAGEYSDTTPEPLHARNIFPAAEQKKLLRRTLLKELLVGFLSCGAAFVLFYLAMKHFF
ncbi:MAG: hypothetical protein IJC75_05875 [Oscillospiraceae bacterium]|nr:hypothetical protein [Oscillospiraceae bacterium]